MRTILILMDSLNRHYLKAYGGDWVKTPNIDRLANKSIVFDNHYAGSLPCMPARRELWTGRYNFLETPWCPLQPFDETITTHLKKEKGTYSHLISDHYHYWEMNGTGYNMVFDTWEFLRGQEGDPWKPMVAKPKLPKVKGRGETMPKLWRQDWVNRSFMDCENDEDYPTVQCFNKAMEFLDTNHKQDNWHLHLEVFDPHEPFFCPQKYKDMYNDNWQNDYYFDWPNYAPVNMDEEGQEGIDHIRNCYAACVTREDVWLGKLLDKMDEYNMWEDTTIILTTDHGHLLGEHGYWAKNYMFDYEELAHIPLIIYYPNAANNGKRINALTAAVDMAPTLLDLHDAPVMKNMHGKSLKHLLDCDEPHNDWVLYGYFGKDVNMTNGKYTFTMQPKEKSTVHHHTATAVNYTKYPDAFHNAECDKFLKQTQLPVYRVALKSFKHHDAPDFNLIYDLDNDPHQEIPIHDETLENELTLKMKELLKRYEAPECQYNRLGID